MPRVLFWLLVLWIGFQLGAGVYEARVSVAEWAADPPASLAHRQLRHVFLDAGGRLGAAFVFLTVLVTLACFVPALLAIQAPQTAMSAADLVKTTQLWARLNCCGSPLTGQAGWRFVFGLAGYERALTLRAAAGSANLRV